MSEEYAEREEDLKGGEKRIKGYNRAYFLILQERRIIE
jgi:hypothetical protein